MQKRNIAVVILLGFITLGIYDLYWLYKTRQELVALGGKVPRFIWLLLPLLALLAVGVLWLFFLIALSDSSDSSQALMPLSVLSMIVGVVAVIAIFPITIYWMYRYSEAVEQVTHGQTTTGFAFGLWLVLAILGFTFIWHGLIQDAFNKLDTPSMPKPPVPRPDQPSQPSVTPPPTPA